MTYSLTTYLTLGKYKSKPLKTVIDSDPKYVLWLIKNVSWMELDSPAKEYLSLALENHTSTDYEGYDEDYDIGIQYDGFWII